METLVSPEIQGQRERQLRYDLQTQFAELVDGSMRTDFELYFNGHNLIGEDGRGMDEITSKSLAEAKTMVKINPEWHYEVRRRELERQEFEEIVEMAYGIGSNTMVVVSDFPLELRHATEDVGGYNVTRKQTMLRVIHKTADGNINMTSQSLDGSNRQALEAIYARFDLKPEDGELLGQRIYVDLTSHQQVTLSDELRAIYDASMSQQFGGQWYAGRQPIDYRNTYDFVCRQQDLIEECTRLNSLGQLNREYMYNFAATMQKRFKDGQSGTIEISREQATNVLARLQSEIMVAGAWAEQQGMVFSACGVSMRSGGFSGSFKNGLELAGYGNKAFSSEGGICTYTLDKCPGDGCDAENVTVTSREENGVTVATASPCGCTKRFD